MSSSVARRLCLGRRKFLLIVLATAAAVFIAFSWSWPRAMNSTHAVSGPCHRLIHLKGLQLQTHAHANTSKCNLLEIDCALSTRRLVLLATQRMNQLLEEEEMLQTSANCANASTTNASEPCACAWVKWWANPLQVVSNLVLDSGVDYNDHILEFVAHIACETATFQTCVRVHTRSRPTAVEFARNWFIRIRINGDKEPEASHSREPREQTLNANANASHPISNVTVPQWPVNASFMVTDYLNYTNPSTLFNIVPPTPFCGPFLLLIAIVSAPDHFQNRDMIRQTFGSAHALAGKSTSLIFIIGRTHDEQLQRSLVEEAALNQDIIQANFVDAYQNMTLKYLSSLAYVYFSCGGSTYLSPGEALRFDTAFYNPPGHLLKADDDFFLNVDVALSLAAANPAVEHMGYRECKQFPFRQQLDRYLVPEYIYSAAGWPPFLLGGTTLMKADVIPKYLEASLSVPIINMDDVYVSGLLARELGIAPQHSTHFCTQNTPREHDSLLRFRQLTKMIHSSVGSVEEFRQVWELLAAPELTAHLRNMSSFAVNASAVC